MTHFKTRLQKDILLTILATLLFSCSNNVQSQKLISEQDKQTEFNVMTHQNLGIILVDSLNVYDKNRNVIGKTMNTLGQMVTIDSVSISKFTVSKSTNRCNLHNFIHVKGSKINGWVYGQSVFEAEQSNRDTSFVIDGISFKIIPTKNFGIGVYDEELDLLSFCGQGSQSPILLYNSKFVKYEYIPVDHKETYSETYVTLDNHDGWSDRIKRLGFVNDTLKLFIEREYQEGFADIEIEIYINDKQSKANVANYQRRD